MKSNVHNSSYSKQFKFFRNALYLKAAPRFFYKGGVSSTAIKLVKQTFFEFLWRFKIYKKNISSRGFAALPLIWRTLHHRLQKSTSLVKFVPHFIKHRTKKIPFGAHMIFRQKQLFRVFGGLTRRSQQISKKALVNELQLVFNQSPSSKLIMFRDMQHKRAESLKPLIRRAKLPHVPNFFTEFYRKHSKIYNHLFHSQKTYKKQINEFAGKKLKLTRIQLYYVKKKTKAFSKFVQRKVNQVRYNLFFLPSLRPRFRSLLLHVLNDKLL